MKRKLRKIKIE